MPDQSSLEPYDILESMNIPDAWPVEPVTGGSDTAIWFVGWRTRPDDDNRYALRVFRPDQLAVFEREIRIMQLADKNHIPVPKVIRKTIWEDRPAMLITWIDGRPLAAQLLANPRLVRKLGSAFGQMQAKIHNIPAPPDMERNRWIEWAGDEPELKARLYNLPSRKTTIIHLDYHPLNVLVTYYPDRISGVLDWTNARAGDPRADFARTYAILRVEPYSAEGMILKWPYSAVYWLTSGAEATFKRAVN